MADDPSVTGFFRALVADQLISRAVSVTVGVVVAGPVGAVVVPVVSKAIEYYGPTVADRTWRWINGQSAVEACITLEAVANLDARSTRSIIDSIVEESAPDASQEARSIAKNYLASIPATLRQTLPRSPSGKSSCPVVLLPRNEQEVFRLLPTFLPPYSAPCSLPDTPYYLHELLGTGGFGAVYKATVPSEVEPRALKFCLDPERTGTLTQEKDRLDRLVADEGGSDWPENVVRLIGHNLSYRTPFLIFEYVPDGDLSIHVQNLSVKYGRPLLADEVVVLVRKLAFAVKQVHAKGLTHRDLKPSNILFTGQTVKLADFGMGAIVPRQDRAVSRNRSSAETALEMRGGTRQYMSPEQKKDWKLKPHPSQDVYSLGVVWYQLLVRDFTEEPGLSLERRLKEMAVSGKQIALLKQCLDDRPRERPQSASDLVDLLDRLILNADELEEKERQAALARKRELEESSARVREQAFWTSVHEQGWKTVAGYQGYLQKWPNGVFARQASREIEILRAEAEYRWRAIFRYGSLGCIGIIGGAVCFGALGMLGSSIGWAYVGVFLTVTALSASIGAGYVYSLIMCHDYQRTSCDPCGLMTRINDDTRRGYLACGAGIGVVVGGIAAIGIIKGMPASPSGDAGPIVFWWSLVGAILGLVIGINVASRNSV